jgi:hypothetical protein
MQGINRIEVKALWALVAIECALLVFFLALSIALMWVPYMSACRQHRVSQLGTIRLRATAASSAGRFDAIWVPYMSACRQHRVSAGQSSCSCGLPWTRRVCGKHYCWNISDDLLQCRAAAALPAGSFKCNVGALHVSMQAAQGDCSCLLQGTAAAALPTGKVTSDMVVLYVSMHVGLSNADSCSCAVAALLLQRLRRTRRSCVLRLIC